MAKILSIGGISFDLYFSGSSLTVLQNRFNLAVGGKYPSDYFSQHVGGGGVNVAVGLKEGGHDAAVLGVIGGNEFTPLISDLLQRTGVDYSACPVLQGYFNISVILLTKSGERTIINYEAPGQQLYFSEEHAHKAAAMDALYLGNLPDVPLAERVAFLRNVRMRSAGIFVVVNMGVKDCRKPLLETLPLVEMADCLIINGHEMCELLKLEYDEVQFNEEFVKTIPVLTKKLVVVTDGEKGSYAWHDGQFYYQEAIAVDTIIDTTGAGDGFTAAFIGEYVVSRDISSALKKGAERSARIIAKIGAT